MSVTGVPHMNTQQNNLSICTRGTCNRGFIKTGKPGTWLLTALLTIVANGLAAQDTATPAAEAEADGSVEVTVEGIASTDGLIYASLYSSADGFPNAREMAIANRSVPASESSNGNLVLNFAAIPAGVFAISVMHDANANGKLDTNFMGIPSEDYGFSQNPKSMFGPPPFDKAAVSLAAGEKKQLAITLK
jgi:uncharacterized protein (DUF2141 family)